MGTENSILQLLSDPDTASKLSEIISSLKSEQVKTDDLHPTTASVKMQEDNLDRTSRKIALIQAIKPFLDERTRQKTDVIIAVLELTKLISGLKNDL